VINFDRKNFFPLKKTLSVKDICILINKNIIDSKINDNFSIDDISSLELIRNNSVVFLNKENFNLDIDSKKVLVISDIKLNLHHKFENFIIVNDLNNSYNLILNTLFFHEDDVSYTDDFIMQRGSYVSKYSEIDKSCFIGQNCVIGRGVKIGKNSIIKNNVVIKNAIIGSDVVICDNTSIGTTGFGFDFKIRGSKNLNPQIGIVYIDDNCHIGSSCTVDRGKIDVTYIGKNCMIDNLVHIAHNVIINDNACIAAQTGISGSVKLGINCTIGGQVGFVGHINIGNNVIISARSGVTKDLKDNSIVAGFPAIDINLWKRKLVRERKNGYK